MAKQFLNHVSTTQLVTHKAVCQQGDFTGKARTSLEQAQQDALDHQATVSLGHKVEIITTIKQTQSFVSDV
jgi:hypothetical protein